MKISLISPYSSIQATGIRTISANLKKEGHDVTLIFLPQKSPLRYEKKTLDTLVELIGGSDLVGISLMTNYFDNVVQLTQKIKEHTNVPVIWGGIHATIRPEECLNYADMVCIGEGEETLAELAKNMEAGQDYFSTQGMWFKHNDKIIRHDLRFPVQDLDSLPFQDYDWKTHYILKDNRIQKMNEPLMEFFLKEDYMTQPTRGCPFGCTSGQTHLTSGKQEESQIVIVPSGFETLRFDAPFALRILFQEIQGNMT